MSVDNLHFRHIMLYEFRKGSNVPNAVKNIQEVYKDNAPSEITVKRWFAKFRRGEFDLSDKPRSGRPSEIDDDFIHNLLKLNPRISTEEIAERLNCDKSTAFRHIKKLDYISKLDLWVPHLLTDKNKLDRVSSCNSLLGRLTNDPFLDRLVTGDEKWIEYNNIHRKRSWRQGNEPGQPTAKAGLHPQKVLMSIWWDCKGVIFYELLPTNETINSDKYCRQLDQLKVAIQEKRPILANRKGIIFHHDNARPHTSMQTQKKLRELNWDLLIHPPYSPDLAPSDFHLFRSLQNNLTGKKFASREALKNYLDSFFANKLISFYDRGIRMLPERWKQVVENDGNYIID